MTVRFGNSGFLQRRLIVLTIIVGSVLSFVRCGGGNDSPTASTPPTQSAPIDQFLSGANAQGVSSVRRDGNPPAPSGGPAAIATAFTDGTAGGSSLVVLRGSAPFQTIFVSLGSAQTARLQRTEPSPSLRARLFQLFDATLLAATFQPTGFLQIDLPSPETELPLNVNFTTSVAGSVELRFQLGAGGAAGTAATLSRSVNGSAVSLIGIVYNRWIGTPGPTSPAPDPVAGAVVSTSLSSRTATTDGNGYFELNTGTASSSCYSLNIARAGLPTFSASRKFGSGEVVKYTLSSTPQYPVLPPCS